MKFILPVIIIILILGAGFWFFSLQGGQTPAIGLPNINLSTNSATPANTEAVTTLATGLDTPWAIGFLPSGDMLVTERKGTVRLISNGVLQENPVGTITGAKEAGEGGLLGIAIDPNFESNHYVYFYYTYTGSEGYNLNRVVRLTYENNQLTGEQTIVDSIPGNSNHDGGRIQFGPDGNLYIGTGDAQEPSLAQNQTSLAGKILRVVNGVVEIFSIGHRNVQGLAWDSDGNMFATEHGRSGVQSGFDELNFIQQGKNYGWPDSEGDEVASGTVGPIRHSGSTNTWAPSGATYLPAQAGLNGSVFFTGLRGNALYEAVMNGVEVSEFKEHFKGEFGRIRDVVVGPDGALYITTSNRDGRGKPGAEDDRVIRINPSSL